MREILGKRRRERSALLSAAVACAQWNWPVVPGAGLDRWACTCNCGRDDCPVPGAHPDPPAAPDGTGRPPGATRPPLLAASTDERMVRWWWSRFPDAPVVLATGRRVAALSVPEEAGVRALGQLRTLGVRIGPVVAAPGRHAFLVAPYSFDELADLLDRHGLDRYGSVPITLRCHGEDGYLALPPSRVPGGPLRWAVAPAGTAVPGAPSPWLPHVSDLVRTLVDTCHSVTQVRRSA
ncbi:bifunctional DNA primase/polymerase [Yinghuangia soli]|uniref:Bifunctional DNA primase/polymerase n=1 Tax=Yinghuangia soli TaxID=2908204 RepID=A0AA41U1U8_9ACTN|nr:bifunctional DNA primase/polymerase [Yinghuangia soli]MCF2526469.1 bifunctional DNA primase/polymerase [Yinghuangia soli]